MKNIKPPKYRSDGGGPRHPQKTVTVRKYAGILFFIEIEPNIHVFRWLSPNVKEELRS